MGFDITYIIIMYPCLLFALCVHEAAHAAMANWCGDPSARLMGRLTLNPMSHIDPIGTVLLPIIGMISQFPFLFGWAKPVPFNPANLNDIRRDPVLIAVAGPASNLLMALGAVILIRVVDMIVGLSTIAASQPYLIDLFIAFILINLILVIFNLIPVPPLDGHYVLHYFLPPSGQRVLEQIGPFGIIIAVLFARPLFAFFSPAIVAVQKFALGV